MLSYYKNGMQKVQYSYAFHFYSMKYYKSIKKMPNFKDNRVKKPSFNALIETDLKSRC